MNARHERRSGFEELHYRESDGIEVSLLWSRTDGGVAVVVNDTRTGEEFALAVEGRNALDAFYHPFAYAA